MIKRNLSTLVLALALEFLTKVDATFAANVGDNTGGGNGQYVSSAFGSNLKDLAIVIVRIFNFLIGIVGAFAIIMIIVGGFRYILASGDEKATAAAKQTITFAVVGLVIALLAVTMVSILGNILGAKDLNVVRIGLP